MTVLVIDTALGACTAAMFDGDRPLAVRLEPMAKGHQERLGGLVRDVVAEGITDPRAIVERVYADVPTSVWPAAEMTVRAQLAYLS